MKDNGTDRDVALSIVNLLTDIGTLVAAINTNLFVPAIVTQPTNQIVELGGTCTYTFTAVNVAQYQWQRQNPAVSTAWANTSVAGYNTNTLTFTSVSDVIYTYNYRCKITGKDGSVIYTNAVTAIPPEEPEAEG